MTITGKELENKGSELFKKIGLLCIDNLNQVLLKKLDPLGSYTQSEHLELDYLVPVGPVCLLGEITSRSSQKSITRKYKTFRNHVEVVKRALEKATCGETRSALWKKLGVPNAKLRDFRDVRDIKGFIILTKPERAEVDLSTVSGITIFYRYEWEVLKEYASCIGKYAKCPFLDSCEVTTPNRNDTEQFNRYSKDLGLLLSANDRFVTSDREHISHVLTFLSSPYELLPISYVWRRDALPNITAGATHRYQRTLIPQKLKEIRKSLLTHTDFIFPNSILAVLSNDCSYDKMRSVLTIPKRYGAINIVDGQHRLFAYADNSVHAIMKNNARILVTAVYFDGVEKDYIHRFSARTFIEINANQTKVSSTHLYGIAFEVLGQTDHRSLAAHILRTVNARHNNKLRGLLKTADSPTGRIKSMEIVGSLGVLTNIAKIMKLQKIAGRKAEQRKKGIENLFGATVAELTDARTLAEKGIVCVERYFNLIAKIFKHDWPRVGHSSNGSAFELTKFIAAFVKLLGQFADEGANWDEVESELKRILENVKKVRSMKNYTSVLFKVDHAKIPDARARISDGYHFLKANRKQPTSIGKILKTK